MMRLMQRFRGGSLAPNVFRWPAWYAPDDFGSPVSLFVYAALLLFPLCLGWLFSIDPRLVGGRSSEEQLFENLTAGFFLLASLLLLASAVAERRWPVRGLYLLGAAGCILIAGEELDWGQRQLGFATPDFIEPIEGSSGTSLHNSTIKVAFYPVQKAFSDLKIFTPLLLCLAVCAARALGRRQLWGLPLPTAPLLLGLLLVVGYQEADSALRLNFALGKGKTLLLLIALYALLSRQPGLLLATAAAGLVSEALAYVRSDESLDLVNDNEILEALLSCAALGYAVELVGHALKRRRAAGERNAAYHPPTPRARRTLPHPWLAVCALIAAGSLALYPMEYFKSRAETAVAQRAYAAISAGTESADYDPGAHFQFADGEFELYAVGNQLVYLRTGGSCLAPGVFFLHIYPASPGDLPGNRREHGYENRDFFFGWYNKKTDVQDLCAAVVPLPNYPIAEIRTGEYDGKVGQRFWERRLVFGLAGYREAYAAAVVGRPAARAAFDVYLTEEALTYIKEECTAADVTGMFIFHAFPANPGDLPEWRQGQEFDNLDFRFDGQGARFDGRCVAVVPRPDYPLERLRVGQWLPQENRQLWSAEFPARR